MDSLTQLTLGAAMGEAVLGKKIGNKAMVFGALAGTIPDLDILFFPFLDEMGMLTIHRGLSHALIFAFITAPIFAWLVFQWYKRKPNIPDQPKASYGDWVWLFFLGLFTHPILDSFTVYGTQLFLPFSDYRVGFNNIFIVDPFYTVPFLLSLIIGSRFKRTNPIRPWINYAGITLSCLYIALTFYNKYQVNHAFEQGLAAQNIQYERFITAPTPLNNVLWYCVAQTDKGYHFGYYSLLDKDYNMSFEFREQNAELLNQYKGTKALNTLEWFSNNYYIAEKKNDQLYFNDVKFGRIGLGKNVDYIFKFELFDDATKGLRFKQLHEAPDIEIGAFLETFWERIKGNK